MQRELLQSLISWRNKPDHLPILLRGARQVGKSFLVSQFGKACFENMVTINFEQSPEYLACFDTLKPQEILNKIEILSRQSITPGKSLLFLDEIQICPNAIKALRYFKEQMSELHVIGAGSLLEFAIRDHQMSMPVGRIQYLYLKQLSFREYLTASGHQKLLDAINSLEIGSEIPNVLHEHAIKLVKEYFILGGMPMVVAQYLRDQSLPTCQEYQTLLLRTYSDDFAKYASSARHKYLQQIFNQAPGLVGQQIKYTHISNEMDPRYLKDGISDLVKAGLLFQIFSTSASGLPLSTHMNTKRFKLLFLDVGLVKRAMKLDIELLFANDLLLLNRGAIAEQFVGQELLAYQNPHDEPELFYWSREEKSSVAEVDYLMNIDGHIVPIEVKSGKTGSLKSLHLLLKERNLPLGIRVSERPLEKHGSILSVPFYMISELPRLVRKYIYLK